MNMRLYYSVYLEPKYLIIRQEKTYIHGYFLYGIYVFIDMYRRILIL